MLDKPFQDWTTYPDHVGIDFPYRAGRNVLASGSGYVRWEGWGSGTGTSQRTGVKAGNAKIVVYDNGIEARYCHLQSLDGKHPGERVEYGDVIGYVGSTGYSTGPHLHMEIWVNGQLQSNRNFWKYVDPNRHVGDGYGNYSRPAGGKGTPLPTEWDEMASRDDVKSVVAEAINERKINEFFLISYASNTFRNGIVLAGFGYWHPLSGEKFEHFSWAGSRSGGGRGLFAGLEVFTPINDRAWDILKEICTQDGTAGGTVDYARIEQLTKAVKVDTAPIVAAVNDAVAAALKGVTGVDAAAVVQAAQEGAKSAIENLTLTARVG